MTSLNLQTFSYSQCALLAVVLYLTYSITVVVYRLFFHPLARFPGPKLAAASSKYEFYWDAVRDGQFNAHIEELHKIYGPIIRINPDELHCNDPSFIDQVYAGGRRRTEKTARYSNAQGYLSARTLAGERAHELHRKRRIVLNKFFSKAAITKLESTIHDVSQRLCDIILTRAGMEEPANLADAYSCFGFDIITSLCYGQEKGLLKDNDFALSFRETIYDGLAVMPVGREWPFTFDLLQALPDSIAANMNPGFARFVAYQKGIQSDIANMVESYHAGAFKSESQTGGILVSMLKSDLKNNDNPVDYLLAEAAVFLTAGTDTVAWTLSVMTVHLLTKPEMLAKLTEELQTVVSDAEHLPKWSILEQLPYFSAMLLESIRLAYGVVARLARVSPDEPLVYEGVFKSKNVRYVVPPGAGVSILTSTIHHNENIFPDSHSFQPERWLTAEGARRSDLEKYLMSFSKGTRQCIGINLAWCELYLCAAALVLRVLPRAKLFETSERDVEYIRDMFVPRPSRESKGIRVLIT